MNLRQVPGQQKKIMEEVQDHAMMHHKAATSLQLSIRFDLSHQFCIIPDFTRLFNEQRKCSDTVHITVTMNNNHALCVQVWDYKRLLGIPFLIDVISFYVEDDGISVFFPSLPYGVILQNKHEACNPRSDSQVLEIVR